MNKKICIYGASGFGREVLTCLLDSLSWNHDKIVEKVVFTDDDNKYANQDIMGVPVIKKAEFDPLKYEVIVAISDPIIRKKIIDKLPPNTNFTKVIHPSVVMSKWVEIGEGSIVTAGTILTTNIKIGKHAHLNLNTTIGHDCKIGNYFTSAPAANISGNCEIGDCVYFGTQSSVRQGIKICDKVTIGMGGVVVKDINEQAVYVGNPLRKLKG